MYEDENDDEYLKLFYKGWKKQTIAILLKNMCVYNSNESFLEKRKEIIVFRCISEFDKWKKLLRFSISYTNRVNVKLYLLQLSRSPHLRINNII